MRLNWWSFKDDLIFNSTTVLQQCFIRAYFRGLTWIIYLGLTHQSVNLSSLYSTKLSLLNSPLIWDSYLYFCIVCGENYIYLYNYANLCNNSQLQLIFAVSYMVSKIMYHTVLWNLFKKEVACLAFSIHDFTTLIFLEVPETIIESRMIGHREDSSVNGGGWKMF